MPHNTVQCRCSSRPLFWTLEQEVAGFRNHEKAFPARKILAGRSPYPLLAARRNLDDLELCLDAETLTLDEYFVQTNVAGLLVLHNGKIAYERYALGNTADTRWVSYSVAKSVTDYLPRRKGSAYDRTTIRALLQMASGVEWDETHDDPESDVNTDD